MARWVACPFCLKDVKARSIRSTAGRAERDVVGDGRESAGSSKSSGEPVSSKRGARAAPPKFDDVEMVKTRSASTAAAAAQAPLCPELPNEIVPMIIKSGVEGWVS